MVVLFAAGCGGAPASAESDLAVPLERDMAVPLERDLALPVDLTAVVDLSEMPDLNETSDVARCVDGGSSCNPVANDCCPGLTCNPMGFCKLKSP
jgi:hypothetical protein